MGVGHLVDHIMATFSHQFVHFACPFKVCVFADCGPKHCSPTQQNKVRVKGDILKHNSQTNYPIQKPNPHAVCLQKLKEATWFQKRFQKRSLLKLHFQIKNSRDVMFAFKSTCLDDKYKLIQKNSCHFNKYVAYMGHVIIEDVSSQYPS